METAKEMLKSAQDAAARGDIAEAAQAYRRAADAFPDNKAVIAKAASGLRACNCFPQAVAVLENGLARMPTSVMLLNHLATTHLENNAPDAAVGCLERVTAIIPGQLSNWLNLATLHAQLGQWKEAAVAFDRALQISPVDDNALLGSGDAFYQLGRSHEAIVAYRRVLLGNPVHPLALFKLGSLLMTAGELEEAESLLHESTVRDPENIGAHINYALVLLRRGAPDEAMTTIRAAIALDPRRAEAHHILANALQETGRIEEGAQHLRTAAEIDPASIDILLDLALIESTLGRNKEAREVTLRALTLEPGNKRARSMLTAHSGGEMPVGIAKLLELAFVADRRHLYDEARMNYEAVLAQSPDSVFAISRLLTVDGIEGRLGTAEAHHQQLIETLSRSNMALVQWQHLAVVAYQSVIRPLPIPLYKDLYQALDQQLAEDSKTHQMVRTTRSATPRQGRRLKIGYLSSLFRDHPVGHVTAALFAAHDRNQFDIHVFYLPNGQPARYTDQIASGAEHFYNLFGTASEMAATIAAQALDILIYIDGYMGLPLLPVVALRPAPIQIFWLGHAGGCDLSFIDYVIADATVIPPGEETPCAEKVVRLPDTFHCASPHAIGEAMTRACAGLPNEGFVYCAFNNPEKIDNAVFRTWMRILRRTDGSVLWLSRTLSAEIEENMRAEAQAAGIDRDRLIFATRLPDKAVHLARHRLSGLFLDTFTHNAATTAIDALWAGLPILTVNGSRFSSRISASLLTAIGLEDMICESIAAYEDRAVSLANNPDELDNIRRRLMANRESYPLFQLDKFCRNFERCLASIQENHRR